MSIEFEKKLAYELSELGIHVQPNFRVPDSDLKIDFYIKAPMRGLIEIKRASLGSAAVAKRAELLKNIYNKFNKSICLFIINLGKSWLISFTLLKKYQKYLVNKGSITINGVSLTIVKILKNSFQISIVPHTLKLTNLIKLNVKDTVNIEFDILGKYIQNFKKNENKIF